MDKNALAGAMKTIYIALVLLGFGIDGAEPIEITTAMQCSLQRQDSAAFRCEIIAALELCHPNR